MLTTFFYTHSVFLKYLKIDNCHYKNYLPTLGFLINVPGTFINFDKFFQGGTYLDEIRLVHLKTFHIFLLTKGSFVLELMNWSIFTDFVQEGTFIDFCQLLLGNVYLEGYVYLEMLFYHHTQSIQECYFEVLPYPLCTSTNSEHVLCFPKIWLLLGLSICFDLQ